MICMYVMLYSVHQCSHAASCLANAMNFKSLIIQQVLHRASSRSISNIVKANET